MLIANTVAVPADRIFSLTLDQLSTPVAWFGLACYTLQIYFDFSGYSDMAVGLGKMFGFEFIENFNFPYIAESMRDFWRRWHISLSTWFRDYLYLPLGGNRGSARRTCCNLVVVFFLCGLWHGASLTFVVWGLYHGLFLVLERTRFDDIQQRLPRTVRHLYTLLVVMMSWVLFRADSFVTAGHFFRALFGLNLTPLAAALPCYMTKQVLWAIGLGILFSGPLYARLKLLGAKASQVSPETCRPVVQIVGFGLEFIVLLAVLSLSAAWLASGTYNPFIYFRF